MANTTKTLVDNVAGVMYEACRKSKIKQPRFKIQFIATIPATKNFGKATQALVRSYQKTGKVACACCGADNVYFKFYKEKGRVIFRAFVKKGNHEELMTVDHDLLKSLGGDNNLSNYNPMCYSCNQLRGSLFAEFKEFKDWYDAKQADEKVKLVEVANFCFIDYEQNKHNNQFFNNVVGAKTLPPHLIEAMKKTMRTDKPDVFKHISMKELITLDRSYANQLLNELVYERSSKTQNCRDIPMGEHDFFVGCTSTDHRKIKLYIEEHVKAQLRKRLHMQKELTAQRRITKEVQKPVKEVNTSFTLKSLWIKFTNIFA